MSSAVWEAIEVDEWRPLALIVGAAVYGVAIVAFAWANAARGWSLPTYWLLLLPYIISEVIAEMHGP